MELLMFELSENNPISGSNDTLKDMKLLRAASNGFLGLPAQIDAQKAEQINSLFGGNTRNDILSTKD